MQMKPLIPSTLCALLVASPLAIAQGTDDTAGTAAASGNPATTEATPSGGEAQTPATGGMDMSGSGMMGGQQPGMGIMGDQSGQSNGMMNMMGNGMMGKGMMGKGMMMGCPGMMGMMHGSKGGGMGMMGCGGKGHGMSERYNRLLDRLDLLEARMAMMQTMLERLLER